MIVIALSGHKQSGKSTTADYLKNRFGFTELSFAYPLKDIIGRQLFGLDDNQLYGNEESKEQKTVEWGLSPREILQMVGTDLFRKHFRDDFWVKLLLNKLKQIRYKNAQARIVISDCRFPNEATALQLLGGYIIRVEKTGQHSKDLHESETALDDYDFDLIIKAGPRDLDSLYSQIDSFMIKINGD